MAANPSVLLLRHGETEWNHAGRLQGRDDSPLTARGREQAAAVARLAAALGVRRVWSSPLGRAQATASAVAGACGVHVETADELAEIDFGACSGGTMADAERRFPGLIEARQSDRWNHAWPQGESHADVLVRVSAWLGRVGELRTVAPTAVVAHQSLHRALLVAIGARTREQALLGAQSAEEVFQVFGDGRVETLVASTAVRAS